MSQPDPLEKKKEKKDLGEDKGEAMKEKRILGKGKKRKRYLMVFL